MSATSEVVAAGLPTGTAPSVSARRAVARRYLGFRSCAIARSTGTLVVVYRDDDEECGDGLRWVTLCDDHGHLVGHETLDLARSHAAYPNEWCERCMGVDGYENDEEGS